MGKLLNALGTPVFRQLWFGNMAANLGIVFQSVGAAWLMMVLTGSPQMVALVQTCVTLPLLFLSLFSGVLADIFDRRRIMLFTQLYLFTVAAVLAALAIAGYVTPELLLLSTLMIGSGMALMIPSWQASLRELVDRDDLPGAIAAHSMGFNLMRSAGPAVGGAVLAVAGASVLFAFSGLCFLVFAVTLLLWHRNTQKAASRESLPSALFSGLRYSAMSPNLIYVFTRGGVYCLLAVALIALLPVVAGDLLGGGSILFGILLGSFGLGAVAAALISTSLRDRFPTELIVRVNFLLSAASLLSVALLTHVYVVVPATFVAGVCWVLTNNTLNVTVQLSVPSWVAGRSLSILHTFLFGGMTIGSVIWGVVAEATGVQTAFIVSAGLLMVGILMGFVMPLPALSDDRLEPANTFVEPDVKIDLAKHDRPITIVIHYNIAPADVPQFLDVMKQRRRIRRRDGALRWMLRRDVEHPEHWSESYTAHTWADYVRHNQRRTSADANVQEKLWALHQGERPPVILRMVEWDAAHGDMPEAST